MDVTAQFRISHGKPKTFFCLEGKLRFPGMIGSLIWWVTKKYFLNWSIRLTAPSATSESTLGVQFNGTFLVAENIYMSKNLHRKK